MAFSKQRFDRTLAKVDKHVPTGENLLDLGYPSQLQSRMNQMGYVTQNTEWDLNIHPEYLRQPDFKCKYATAFEVLEHLLDPYCVLKHLQSEYLLITVPLKVWFRSAHWIESDEHKQHFHEFEPRQIRKLLEHTSWEILEEELWRTPFESIGWRPFLRLFWPSYYFCFSKKIGLTNNDQTPA